MNGSQDFREYLERYCKEHRVSIEEALTHKVVIEVGLFYGLQMDEIDHFLPFS